MNTHARIEINRTNKAVIGDFVLELNDTARAVANAINESITMEEAVAVYQAKDPTIDGETAKVRVTEFLKIVNQLERGIVPAESEIFTAESNSLL